MTFEISFWVAGAIDLSGSASTGDPSSSLCWSWCDLWAGKAFAFNRNLGSGLTWKTLSCKILYIFLLHCGWNFVGGLHYTTHWTALRWCSGNLLWATSLCWSTRCMSSILIFALVFYTLWQHSLEHCSSSCTQTKSTGSSRSLGASSWYTGVISFEDPNIASTSCSTPFTRPYSPTEVTQGRQTNGKDNETSKASPMEVPLLCHGAQWSGRQLPGLLEALDYSRRSNFHTTKATVATISRSRQEFRPKSVDMGNLARSRYSDADKTQAISKHISQAEAATGEGQAERYDYVSNSFPARKCRGYQVALFAVLHGAFWPLDRCHALDSRCQEGVPGHANEFSLASCHQEELSRHHQSPCRHSRRSGKGRAPCRQDEGKCRGRVRCSTGSTSCCDGCQRTTSPSVAQALGGQRFVLADSDGQLREAEKAVPRNGGRSQGPTRCCQDCFGCHEREARRRGCQCHSDRSCRGRSAWCDRGRAAQECPPDPQTMSSFCFGRCPSRDFRWGRCGNRGCSTQQTSSFRQWLMKDGSVAGCLRNPARVPRNLHVSWEDGYTACNDVDQNGPLHETSSSLDRPIHSIERHASCSFVFEALGDATWMEALVFFQESGDELQRYARLLSSPTPLTMMISPPLARCSLNLLDDEPCNSIHDRLHLMQQPRSTHILYRLLHEQGNVEFPDEGPVLYVMSWFLHGDRRRTCNAPRRIRLDRWFMNWQNDIRQTWVDRMDADRPFDVHVVFHAMPQHPNFDEHLHIVVAQRPRPHDRAALFACLFAGQDESVIGLTLTARFSAPLLRYDDLVHHFEVVPHCSFRDCTFMSDDTFIHFGSPAQMRVRNGLCIQGRVGPVPIDDVVALMQTWPNDPLEQDNLRLTQLMPQWEQMIPTAPHGANAAPDADDNDVSDDEPAESGSGSLDIDDIVSDGGDAPSFYDHLYRKTHGYRRVRLDDASYDNMVLDAANAWNRPPDTVVDLLPIAALPANHEPPDRCYITEFAGDRDSPRENKSSFWLTLNFTLKILNVRPYVTDVWKWCLLYFPGFGCFIYVMSLIIVYLRMNVALSSSIMKLGSFKIRT